MNSQFLEARADAAALLQPADALLDHGTLAIGPLVKLHRRIPPRCLVVLARDHRTDALLLEPVADAPRAIAFVPRQLPRLFAASLLSRGDDRGHQRVKARRFVHLPRWSSLICSVSMMRAQMPFLRHVLKWWYAVCQGPKRSGRSRQGAPVMRIQKMALSRVRRSLAGRPVRALLAGKCGSTNAHC